MAKTPQAKAAQAAVAVKRRKSSGANAARDKPNKGERRASKPEEEEEGKKKEEEVQSEPVSWDVLNQIGVEVSARNRLLVSLSCCGFEMVELA